MLMAPQEMRDDALHVHVAGPERPVHPLLHRFVVGEGARLHLRGDRGVDVLEVDVGDPLRRLPGQLRRVGATDQQVTGVQAQGHRLGVGLRQGDCGSQSGATGTQNRHVKLQCLHWNRFTFDGRR